MRFMVGDPDFCSRAYNYNAPPLPQAYTTFSLTEQSNLVILWVYLHEVQVIL